MRFFFQLSGDWTQVEVIRLSTESGGLGFGIVGGTSTGVVVKTILPGSPADKDGHLRPGDHILQIGNVNTSGMSSQQVATLLRNQHPAVEMIVGRPINYADKPVDTADCFTIATRAALCASTLEESIQRQVNHKLSFLLQFKNQIATASSASTTAVNPTPSTMSPSLSCAPIEEEDVASADVITTATRPAEAPPSPPRASVAEDAQASTSEYTGPPPPVPSSIDLRKPCDCAPFYVLRDPRRPSQASTSSPASEKPFDVTSEMSTGSDAKENHDGSKSNGGRQISLKCLQEMALTVFLRENWQKSKFEAIDVLLLRDPALGLGITVAGYVHKKEEISGIFVKSLVPRSAAALSGQICVHDLILEVNNTSLEHLSHADSVRTLVKSGDEVRLRLVRFPQQSAQAQCLKMLQQQETETQVIDVKSSNPDLVAEWKRRVPEEVDIMVAVIKPDRKAADGGLGISLEGTVDVVNGHQLCPHHYIESIRENGPVAQSGVLQSGDELLQVNHSPLYGESHVTVRQALTRAVHSGAPVTLIVARRTQHVSVYQPRTEKSLPLSYPLLTSTQETLVKAKSEIDMSSTRADTTQLLQQVSKRLRSRSLENFNGLAVWNCVPLVINLEKDARGLGFSIVDYQDPSHSGESVIVVQSLVPGGVAQADGRIVPGDRLLFVNNHDLSNSSLERAVAVLKAARMGRVRLGIAKPVPIDQCRVTSHSPLYSRSERLLARGRSPRSRRRQPSGVTSSQETVWIGTSEQYRRLHPQGYYPSRSPSCARSERSLDGVFGVVDGFMVAVLDEVNLALGSWAYDVVYLPSHLERSVKIQKGPLPLGIVLDSDKDKGVNGSVVKSICGKKAVALDGRIQVGDYVVKINTESLRNATNSQARAVLKRTNLIGTQCNVTYITSADAKTWKERFHRDVEPQSPVVNRLSPKVFPKFYRSPYLGRRESLRDATDDETDAPSIASDLQSQSVAEPSTSSHVESGDASEDVETRRRRFANLIDGAEVDTFVQRIMREALRDAIVELCVSQRTPDWKSSIASTSSEVLPPTPTPSLSEQPEKEEEVASTSEQTPSNPVELREPKTRRESEPAPSNATSAVSQNAFSSPTHILSTEEEIEFSAQEKEVEQAIASTSTLISNAGEKANGDVEKPANEAMSRVTTASRTPSVGSDSFQQQARQLARSKYWGEARTVVLHREPNKSFGISIVGGRVEVSQKGGLPGTGNTVSGIFIKSVLPNSPAGRSGQMNMGDRVISVNDVDLREATHEQAVAAIKNATNPVRFVLQSLHTNQHHMINSASNSTVGSVRIENSRQEEIPVVSAEAAVPVVPKKPLVTPVLTPAAPSEPQPQPQDPPVQVDPVAAPLLNRDSSETEFPPPPPHLSSKLEEFEDKLEERAELNVTPVPDELTFSREDTVKPTRRSLDNTEKEKRENSEKLQEKPSVDEDELARNTLLDKDDESKPVESRLVKTPSVEKELKRKSSKSSGEQKCQRSVEKQDSTSSKSSARSSKKKAKAKESSSGPLIVSDVSSTETRDDDLMSNEDEVVEHWEALSKMGVERISAAALPRSPEDNAPPSKFFYTPDKLKRKYGGEDNEVILVDCDHVPEAGLGISLAGNRNRDKQSVFVVNVRVACPLPIRVGDELLEVNGRVLQGISHVSASSVVRECCEKNAPIEIVLRRRDGAMDDCAVRNDELASTSSASTSSPHQKEPMVEESSTSSATLPNPEASRKKSVSIDRTAIDTGKETLIEIDKDGKGLGLSIVGGSDTVLGTVVIHEVYPDGAAAHDGRLKPGDQVLEVNNVSLRGVTHDQAISALRRTPPKVRLLIYRDVNLQLSLLDPTQIYNIFEVELQKKPGRGLGLSIVGRKNEPGVYVSEIVRGGTAEADGRLMTGDQILAVNGQDVANCMQEDVAAMLKTCTGKVHLKVGRWKITETANRVHAAAEAASLAKSCTTPRVEDTSQPPATCSTAAPKVEEKREVPPPAPPMRPIITHTSPDGEAAPVDEVGLSPVTEEPSSGGDLSSELHRSIHEEEKEKERPHNNNSLAIDILHDLKEEGSETLLVELRKVADQQLGMGIGKRTRGILVTSLQPGSTAAEKLRVGDRIMAVNALPVSDQLSAVTFVKASGERLFLQIARPRLSPS
ncbi:unnamed protein product [Caenorhabditis auriculariae]|uniref:PDZ domain-containing protein n=1 Tax=Caenorhabditis auriculariae TaxID=2777116 RepID=A0A8S1H8W9_9PELO|nr:unnamed protein product [Caenorhabditis auriculariae]